MLLEKSVGGVNDIHVVHPHKKVSNYRMFPCLKIVIGG